MIRRWCSSELTAEAVSRAYSAEAASAAKAGQRRGGSQKGGERCQSLKYSSFISTVRPSLSMRRLASPWILGSSYP